MVPECFSLGRSDTSHINFELLCAAFAASSSPRSLVAVGTLGAQAPGSGTVLHITPYAGYMMFGDYLKGPLGTSLTQRTRFGVRNAGRVSRSRRTCRSSGTSATRRPTFKSESRSSTASCGPQPDVHVRRGPRVRLRFVEERLGPIFAVRAGGHRRDALQHRRGHRLDDGDELGRQRRCRSSTFR